MKEPTSKPKPKPKPEPKAKPTAKKKCAAPKSKAAATAMTKPKAKPKAKPESRERSPLTPRQEKYAQLAASGMRLREAAQKAGYGNGSERSLNRNARVQARIVQLRAKVEARGEELALLTLAKKRRFLAELVLTPVAQVGPESWLAQEWERLEIPGRGSNSSSAGPTVKQKIKLADKLRAIELDSKLANHFHFAASEPDPSANASERNNTEAMRAIAERVRKILPVMWERAGAAAPRAV